MFSQNWKEIQYVNLCVVCSLLARLAIEKKM